MGIIYDGLEGHVAMQVSCLDAPGVSYGMLQFRMFVTITSLGLLLVDFISLLVIQPHGFCMIEISEGLGVMRGGFRLSGIFLSLNPKSSQIMTPQSPPEWLQFGYDRKEENCTVATLTLGVPSRL